MNHRTKKIINLISDVLYFVDPELKEITLETPINYDKQTRIAIREIIEAHFNVSVPCFELVSDITDFVGINLTNKRPIHNSIGSVPIVFQLLPPYIFT